MLLSLAIYLRSHLDAVVQQIPRGNGLTAERAGIGAFSSLIGPVAFAAHALDAYRTC